MCENVNWPHPFARTPGVVLHLACKRTNDDTCSLLCGGVFGALHTIQTNTSLNFTRDQRIYNVNRNSKQNKTAYVIGYKIDILERVLRTPTKRP